MPTLGGLPARSISFIKGNNMKMTRELLPMQNRRLFLAALFTSPLLLYIHSFGRNDSFPAMALVDSEGFVIMNGWVLLKQDIAEFKD